VSKPESVDAFTQGRDSALRGRVFSSVGLTEATTGLLYVSGYLSIHPDDLDALSYLDSVEDELMDYQEMLREQEQANVK